MPTPQSTQSLADVFYQLSLDERGISAEVVDEYVRSHPGSANELTEFSIELALEQLCESAEIDAVDRVIDHAHQSAMVSVAISRFHNRLYNAGHAGTLRKQAVPAQPANPFLALDRAAFRQFVKQLDVSTVFACKLRDRLIDPFTIPRAFVGLVSKLLGVTPESLLAHLAGPMVIGATAQHYKADGKPSVGKSESFPDAVRNSGLTDAQQQRLLTL